MGYFKQYRPFYRIPERVSPEIARERRLAALLEREPRYSQVPNFERKLGELRQAEPLSRDASKKDTKNVSNVNVKGGQTSRPKAGSMPAAASIPYRSFTEAMFADPEKRAAYRAWRRSGGSAKTTPTGADKRQYNPTGKDGASTIYGTNARTSGVRQALNSLGFNPRFIHANQVVPCIQRAVRQEVMFALGHAGRGYHTKKRRNANSGVPC